MIAPAQIVSEARRWIGVPYVHQGRTAYGVDCIGLIICVRDTIESWPDACNTTRDYSRQLQGGMLLELVERRCVRLSAPEDGAMILIRWPKHAYPTHAAFYAGGNIIHAYQRARRVIETGFRAHWLRDAHSYWRLPGVLP